ncbi:MFS transporter, partial [Candidatus Micrarchaeota archaeon]|nr:MFS transporter [Candidatus Micrarchaeota archaeon]
MKLSEIQKIYLISLFSGAVYGGLSIAVPLYLDFLGFELSRMGLVFGFGALFAGILSIFLGHLTDTFGRKKALSFLSLINAFSISIITAFKSITAFITYDFLSRFTSISLWNTFVSRLTDLTGTKERAVVFGKYIFSYSLVLAGMIAFTGYVLLQITFQQFFIFLILLSLIMFIITLKINEEVKK